MEMKIDASQGVAAEVYGEGLPYAPENWPEEGDIWAWKTGRRVVPKGGHFQDRYLYLPDRLYRLLKEEKEIPESGSGSKTSRKQHIFPSKPAVTKYINTYFPGTDLKFFFDSFSWRIPALLDYGNPVPIDALSIRQITPEAGDNYGGLCKANNEGCRVMKEEDYHSHVMPCDVCCSEPFFCRGCCCILCGKTVSTDYGGSTYVECQENVGNGICGHVSHTECALQCLLAGKIEEEYHCRRCDGRTDIISLLDNILQSKATDLNDEVVKILSLGSSLLRRSEKPAAKELLLRVELILSKGKFRSNREDMWKEDQSLHSSDNDNGVMGVTINDGHAEVKTGLESSDFLPPPLKLEAEVDQVLRKFKNSQEVEYRVAEEILQEQKIFLQKLHQQLEYEKNVLADQNSPAASDAVRERKKQIRRELQKFEKMKNIANGFGKTPYDITKNYFGFSKLN